MARRKFFKFKLNRKQKKTLIVSVAFLLCSLGVLWILTRPSAPRPHRPVPVKTVVARPAVTKRTTPPKSDARPLPALPPAPAKRWRFSKAPKITFVIDDVGNHNRFNDQLKALGDKVTYAVLPLLPYSRYYGNLTRTTGAEIILHLPLDTTLDKVPGRGLIVDTMSRENILDILARDLDSVPNHVGVNNHMGSRGTANRELMTVILSELKRRNLFFLDSYTTMESVVPAVGREVGLPILARGVFLDNVDSAPAIRSQINQLRTVARQKGNAIAIGHYRANTLEVLADEIPRLEREGFEIIDLREMLQVQRD